MRRIFRGLNNARLLRAEQGQSRGPAEAVFEKQPSGSPLLSTIIYVQRGSFILKIVASCNGCAMGSIESSLESLAQLQLTQAVKNGFPGPAPNGGGGGHVRHDLHHSRHALDSAGIRATAGHGLDHNDPRQLPVLRRQQRLRMECLPRAARHEHRDLVS